MKRNLLFGGALAAMMLMAPSAYSQDEVPESDIESLRNEVASLRADREESVYQEKLKKIWGRQKSWNIGFASSSWNPENCTRFKPNFGFTTSLNKTYFVHKKPIAGILKIGIDATWFDVTYVNYKSNPAWALSMGYDPDFDDDFGEWDDYDDYDDDFELGNLGSHQIDLAVGVGVSATVAPFTFKDNALNQLKGTVYCRFLPSMSMMLISEPDDTRINYAFVPYVTFGAQISWKALSLFVEGRWGSANYKIGGLNDDFDDYEEGDDVGVSDLVKFDKLAAKNAGVRVGIGLRF